MNFTRGSITREETMGYKLGTNLFPLLCLPFWGIFSPSVNQQITTLTARDSSISPALSQKAAGPCPSNASRLAGAIRQLSVVSCHSRCSGATWRILLSLQLCDHSLSDSLSHSACPRSTVSRRHGESISMRATSRSVRLIVSPICLAPVCKTEIGF